MRGLDPERYQPFVVLPSEGRYSELLREHAIRYTVLPFEPAQKFR